MLVKGMPEPKRELGARYCKTLQLAAIGHETNIPGQTGELARKWEHADNLQLHMNYRWTHHLCEAHLEKLPAKITLVTTSRYMYVLHIPHTSVPRQMAA